MDYDDEYYNHKWEGFVDNILLNGKLINLMFEIWGCPSSGSLHRTLPPVITDLEFIRDPHHTISAWLL